MTQKSQARGEGRNTPDLFPLFFHLDEHIQGFRHTTESRKILQNLKGRMTKPSGDNVHDLADKD